MILSEEIYKSPTKDFIRAVTKRKNDGLPIISLGIGEPDFDVPEPIKASLISVLKDYRFGYSDPMGLVYLREKIASKLKSDNLINCSSENIIVTSGSKQAFVLICMSLLNPGDEVIVINPSFVSYIPQLLIAEPSCKIKTLDINKSDFSLSIHEIERQLTDRTKLLIINSPNNPTGYVLDSELLKQIYLIAENKDFYVISDEVYEKLIFSWRKHFSIGSIEDKPHRVITINSFSKSHAMSGWGLGYACFPICLRYGLSCLQKHINNNTSTILQTAIEKAFNLDNGFLEEYNTKLLRRSKILIQTISTEDFFSLIPPDAGFFAFVDISKTLLDSNTFCSRLIEETGVALTPGLAFGDSWDDHIRISYANSEETLEEGLKMLLGFVRSFCQKKSTE